MALDLEYIEHWSLGMDFRILWKTISVGAAWKRRLGGLDRTNYAAEFSSRPDALDGGDGFPSAARFGRCARNLFLITLTFMLFRPPDLEFYWLDRIALLLLLFVVLLRVVVLRRRVTFADPIMWPMAGLLLLGLGSLLSQPYEAQSWSVFASKWVVPFRALSPGRPGFRDAASLRRFEVSR